MPDLKGRVIEEVDGRHTYVSPNGFQSCTTPYGAEATRKIGLAIFALEDSPSEEQYRAILKEAGVPDEEYNAQLSKVLNNG